MSHEEQSVLVIDNTAGKISQPDYSIEVTVNDSHQIPAIAGISPSQITVTADGKDCFHAVVLPGLLEDAVTALMEYQAMLARRQQSAMDTIPVDMITPCFLARYLHGPALHLESGFPAREWDEEGYLRVLVNFDENFPTPAGIFSLPDGYSELQLSF